jgi:hypothetical protein
VRPVRYVSALVGAIVLLLGFSSAAGAATSPSGTFSFRGVNWADPRDNFVTGNVVPTGLSDTDNPQRTAAKAAQILAGFRRNLDANTVRLPVNPATVSGAWWPSYRAVIRTATQAHMKVILSYWEADTSKDGLIDNVPDWNAMWATLIHTFRADRYVYFEPMNEPHGYSYADWSSICAQWIAAYPVIPRGRIVLSGTGYNTDVTQLGADPRFSGTLLSVHDYTFFNPGDTTEEQFAAGIAKEVGAYTNRTIIDEFGAPMTDGTDYSASPTTSANVAFIDAIAQYAHDNHLGTVYWPGLRAGDGYSMEQLTGTFPHLKLANSNESGRAKLRYSWGLS